MSPTFFALPVRTWRLASIALALAACGGSTPSSSQSNDSGDGGAHGSAAAGPLTFDDFVVRYLDAYCVTRTASCPQYGVTFDEAACRKAQESPLRATYAAAMASGATFDGAAAESCVAAVDATAQIGSNAAALVAFSQVTKACADMYTGRPKGVGESCTDDVQCQDDTTSYPACSEDVNGPTCGTVLLTTAAASGGPCSESAICPDGLWCSNSTCVAPLGVGSPCDAGGGAGGVCADGLVCTGSSGPDTCQASWPGAGSPCQCGIFCAPNVAYCDASTGLCTKIPSDGAACGNSSDSSGCHDASECIDGTCRPQWVGSLCD